MPWVDLIRSVCEVFVRAAFLPLLFALAVLQELRSGFKKRPAPRHVLITGAASGLGAEIARRYAAPGVRLTLLDVSRTGLDATARECESAGASTSTIIVDVTQQEAMRTAVLAADAAMSVDLVIANAGIAYFSGGGGSGAAHDITQMADALRRVSDVNIGGVLNTILPLLPRFTERCAGQIAVMASLSSFIPSSRDPAYAMSKVAVRYLCQGLRARLHPYGVAVNAICPGFVDTPLTRAYPYPQPLKIGVAEAGAAVVDGLARDVPVIMFPFSMSLICGVVAGLPMPLCDAFMRYMGFPGIAYFSAADIAPAAIASVPAAPSGAERSAPSSETEPPRSAARRRRPSGAHK